MNKIIICFKCKREIDVEDLINNFCPYCNKSFKDEKYE